MNRINLKTNQNNLAIKEYKKAVENGLRSHHVIPKGEMCAIKRAGASPASQLFDTHAEAITIAKKIAKNN